MISVVMPVHNGEAFLRESIDSVLSQPVDLELILIDDASTDSSPEIMKEYRARDERVKYFRMPENKKLPGALNAGFMAARGDLLTWTSDDNIFLPGALYEMKEALELTGADVVYAAVNDIDEKGRVIRRNPTVSGDIEKIFCQNVVHACFMFRFKVYQATGNWDVNLFGGEDWDWWMRAALKRFRFVYLNRVLYHYRVHPHTITAMHWNECQRSWARVWLKNRIWWKYHWALYLYLKSLTSSN